MLNASGRGALRGADGLVAPGQPGLPRAGVLVLLDIGSCGYSRPADAGVCGSTTKGWRWVKRECFLRDERGRDGEVRGRCISLVSHGQNVT